MKEGNSIKLKISAVQQNFIHTAARDRLAEIANTPLVTLTVQQLAALEQEKVWLKELQANTDPLRGNNLWDAWR